MTITNEHFDSNDVPGTLWRLVYKTKLKKATYRVTYYESLKEAEDFIDFMGDLWDVVSLTKYRRSNARS